ncbi:hypothetical protein M413DRAFT_137755 [Hebeloma cylindrosporum]|uniref:Uncharacterized protein n=1 Tax=Hebeloma cylindrosporum TaxID=76867 RepID=A0A0C3CBZ9_HEBCY|nr:hypothetical protein M413DRAFT_137755 [Hebeloma cylindrosporum h7]
MKSMSTTFLRYPHRKLCTLFQKSSQFHGGNIPNTYSGYEFLRYVGLGLPFWMAPAHSFRLPKGRSMPGMQGVVAIFKYIRSASPSSPAPIISKSQFKERGSSWPIESAREPVQPGHRLFLGSGCLLAMRNRGNINAVQ